MKKDHERSAIFFNVKKLVPYFRSRFELIWSQYHYSRWGAIWSSVGERVKEHWTRVTSLTAV